MSFVEAFYSFNFDITNVDTGRSAKVRQKTPRHPYEPLQHLYARALAFVHSWEQDLVFSRGLFEPAEPTLWKRDLLGNTLKWVEVGCPPRRKIQTALRAAPPDPLSASYAVYFYSDAQILDFCGELRGSKSNWISDVNFFRIDPQTIEALIPLEKSSAHWSVTVADSVMYMLCDGVEFQTSVKPLDMWHEFQGSIDNLGG